VLKKLQLYGTFGGEKDTFIFILKLFQSCWLNIQGKYTKDMMISVDNGDKSANGGFIVSKKAETRFCFSQNRASFIHKYR
jgi:hypothetical protein